MIQSYMLHIFLLTIISVSGFIYIIKSHYSFPFCYFNFFLQISLFGVTGTNIFLCFYILSNHTLEIDNPYTLYLEMIPFILTIPCLMVMKYKKIAFLKTRSIFKNIWNYVITFIFLALLFMVGRNNEDFTIGFTDFPMLFLVSFLTISLATSYISFLFIIINCHNYEKTLTEGYSKIFGLRGNRHSRRTHKEFIVNDIKLSSIDNSPENYKKDLERKHYPVYCKKGAYVVFSEDVY